MQFLAYHLLRRTLVCIALVASVQAACLDSAHGVSPSEDGLPKRVLVLLTHRRSVPINDEWESGLRQGLQQHWPNAVAWDSEYLDLHRVVDAKDRQSLLDLVEEKYRTIPPDLIVLVHDMVVQEFVKKERFRGIPVVCCSILKETSETLAAASRFTGVIYRMQARATMDKIQSILPQSRRVIVVSGSGAVDSALLSFIERDLQDIPDWEIDFWTGIPRAELLQRCSQLAEGTVLLFNSYMSDSGGEVPTIPRDIARDLAMAASVPVFGMYDTLMGTGIVGGCLVSARDQGEIAGELAARLLKGHTPSHIGFVGGEDRVFTVDWSQLQRWKISPRSLPQGTVVVSREMGVLERNWPLVAAVATIVLVQSATIVGLLASSRRRRRVEQALAVSRNEAYHLAGKILTVQEDERRRLAREMHDDVAQRLAVLTMETQQQLQSKDREDQENRPWLEKLHQDLVDVSTDVRQLSRELHPGILEDLGLVHALEVEIERNQEKSGTAIRFDHLGCEKRFSLPVELCVFRVAQEAIRNALRHSRSPSIRVFLCADLEKIYLEVEDQGEGFDPLSPASRRGVGLVSMRERARLVGGELRMDSKPNLGTIVSLDISIADKPHEST
jgi:signal transduction histidine kinase